MIRKGRCSEKMSILFYNKKNISAGDDKGNKLSIMKVLILVDIILTTLTLLILLLARNNKAFCDFYVKYIYSIWVNVFGRFWGIFPFSVAEVILYLLVLLIPIILIILIVRKFRDLARVITGVITLGTILLFLYGMNCGINYGHSSYSEQSNMSLATYSTEELADMCTYLTTKVNEYAVCQRRNEDGIMIEYDIQGKAQETMNKIGEEDKLLKGYYPKPKALMNSNLLSVQQLAGIYVPFTIEANYNKDMPCFEQVFTACHELSHMRGYMQEEEANYLAFISCINSEYNSFKYGGYMEGWVYATNELYARDSNEWNKIEQMICGEAVADLEYNNSFWARFDGAVAELSDKVNDSYLKANGQEDGVESYDRMVSLMMEWYKNVIQLQ